MSVSVFFFILIVLDNTAHLSQRLDTVDHLGMVNGVLLLMYDANGR